MQFKQGDRVEYRTQQDEQAQGKIERAEGSGQQASYTIKNERNKMTEQVPENRIERKLQ
ncbi:MULTISPECIES: hypothetical protein [unclassified Streptomyces]|uniref:hypothetical protein n=1 Tax=unclassified Streptomyces TaxID=2593676 RepID=UPI00224DD4BA|nr:MULTISPECIES: hypothetical protein [unclassified Streptomyces]WSP58617.1 hypothetical protein OG306_32730 [Streptomyces sp. NBC_01241]WSU20805.1 hypothetical protein OG508_07260 [Streptomyces sp. NBC_01108]MCX4790392.1 hypothetical protein [Streptomyces sp. NBC_01221]MCX4793879.1 hypothetical protein [Streptomyces sp. NBC_01242]WSJ35295.1 hypothetical protein OG772_03965 [Streptomyces sp. NBC_01321]